MNNEFKYDLTFTAIVKDEALYIEEWILFHLLVGVKKFYIYDNGSKDNTYDVLKKFIDLGIVEYKYLPGKNMQLFSYMHSIYSHKNETKYMGFIDADEFVFPVIDENLIDVIDPTINEYNASGIGINWRMYGSNNNINRVEGLIIENYKQRALDSFDPNKHVKTICNPRNVLFFRTPHNPIYFKGNNIDENGKIITGPFNYNGTCNKLRINHYFTKSVEEYVIKMNRGRADSYRKRDMSDFYRHDKNDIYDYIMEKYVNLIKDDLVKEEGVKKLIKK